MQIRSARVSFPIAVDLEDATDFDFIGRLHCLTIGRAII